MIQNIEKYSKKPYNKKNATRITEKKFNLLFLWRF